MDFFAENVEVTGAHVCTACRSRQAVSDRYLLAKIGVDTAENESRKGSQKVYALKNPVGDMRSRPEGSLGANDLSRSYVF